MAERERHLKSFIEIEEEQRAKTRCDFSKLTAPLREYQVTQRNIVGKNKWGGMIVMYRTKTTSTPLGEMKEAEEVTVYEGQTRDETKWALVEASEAIDAARRIYKTRNA